jgi:hypothetical protein
MMVQKGGMRITSQRFSLCGLRHTFKSDSETSRSFFFCIKTAHRFLGGQ